MKKQEKTDQERQNLLIRYLTEKTTEAEQRDVESWILASDHNRKEFMEIQRILEKVDVYYYLSAFDEDKAWDAVRSRIHHSQVIAGEPALKSGRKRFPAILKYAAVALILVTTGLFGYHLVNRNISGSAIQHVSSREKDLPKDLILPDGTNITLNSNTDITYPTKFSAKYREVTLKGEAFFDVQPDPDCPFVIDAGEARINVLGTSFNVCAYPASETIEVVVETGKVEILQTTPEPTNPVLLTPGEKATLSKKERKLIKQKNNDPNFNAWKTYNLLFENSKLSYVIQNLEKTYHVDIQTPGLNTDELFLTAQFYSKSIEFILDVIRITFNLELKTENDRYILTKNNQNKEAP